MMNRKQKEDIVKDLREKIESARAVFLTNLIGIPSNDSVAIRKDIREKDGGLVVTRNTLFALAAKGTNTKSMLSGLKGPKAVAFAFEDAPGVAKVLYEASKEFEEIISFEAGLLGDKELSKQDMIDLAKLPSREQMLATLLATFNAPVSAFARVLHAIKEQKEEGGESAEAAETAATEESSAETTTEDKKEE